MEPWVKDASAYTLLVILIIAVGRWLVNRDKESDVRNQKLIDEAITNERRERQNDQKRCAESAARQDAQIARQDSKIAQLENGCADKLRDALNGIADDIRYLVDKRRARDIAALHPNQPTPDDETTAYISHPDPALRRVPPPLQ